jgi:20S proteasome subunit alpha 6
MRTPSKLAEYQRKLFRIDDHIGISIAGLTADARVLCKYMRREALNHRFVYEAPLQVARLVRRVADKSQIHTQRMGRRPYGVGMLVAGCDRTGPHLFETCPSGNMFEYHAQAIGARSQSAKTYLERTYEEYPSLPLDELVRHALRALRETTGRKTELLNEQNLSIAIVGKDHAFRVLSRDERTAYLASIDESSDDPAAAAEPMEE